MRHLLTLSLLLALLSPAAAQNAPREEPKDGEDFSQEEIVGKAETFFGDVSEGLARAVRRAFEEQGEPNAYIAGEEASGAIGIGARYGSGTLHTAEGLSRKVFWQGPSVGFDLGGDASKVFTLVYKLDNLDDIYQRFPGVDGSYFFIGGVGVNYLRSDDIVLAPIRSGVGVRTGASVGYLHFTEERSWWPF